MKWKRAVLLPVCGLLLMTTGCFRPAGETVESSISAAVDPAANVMVDQDRPATVEDEPLPVTPGFTLEAASTLPSERLNSGPTSALPITLIPLGSGMQTPTSAPLVVTLANVVTAPAFITPGVPLAPITLEPGAPFPGQSDQIEVLPTQPAPDLMVTPTSLPGTGDDCLYIVQPGDSLYQISLNQGVTLQDLRAANPDLTGENPLLQIGQQITLPGCGETPGTTAAADAPALTATPVQELLSATSIEDQGEEYIVQRGDTLYGIALRYGVTVQAIINANVGRLADPNRIQIGDRLIIPNSGN